MFWARFKLAEAGRGDATWCLGWMGTWCGIAMKEPDPVYDEPRRIPAEWVDEGTIKVCDGCLSVWVAQRLAPGFVYRMDMDREVPTTAEEIMRGDE